MTREEAKWRLADHFRVHDDGRPTPKLDEAVAVMFKALQEPERKKGRWEDFGDDNSYRCTACGEIWALNDGTPEENNMNYCPNCGADMRG